MDCASVWRKREREATVVDCKRAILQYHDSATLRSKHFTIPRPQQRVHTRTHTHSYRAYTIAESKINDWIYLSFFCFISFRFADSQFLFAQQATAQDKFNVNTHRTHSHTLNICARPLLYETSSRTFYFLSFHILLNHVSRLQFIKETEQSESSLKRTIINSFAASEEETLSALLVSFLFCRLHISPQFHSHHRQKEEKKRECIHTAQLLPIFALGRQQAHTRAFHRAF